MKNDKIAITEKTLYKRTTIVIPDSIEEVVEIAERIKKWFKYKKVFAVAFNQLGFEQRCFVINASRFGLSDSIIINPTFEPCKNSKIVSSIEWCVSFPGRKFVIKRHKMIKMTYYSLSKKEITTIKLHGMSAIICQHEISHLNGTPDDRIEELN
jgi:peptide deformylase